MNKIYLVASLKALSIIALILIASLLGGCAVVPSYTLRPLDYCEPGDSGYVCRGRRSMERDPFERFRTGQPVSPVCHQSLEHMGSHVQHKTICD